ncbi:hypothetical protein B0H17DRAFT_385388 [Mycena rosella]|uniref:Uncharacterized protein n=1 Tax=Mycena rosella TaxID=1033263 RepID=A0AAD7G119_MYCRO|nr:hypothetical protein B0H17DRAFT_385388 [Mycena rosella]
MAGAQEGRGRGERGRGRGATTQGRAMMRRRNLEEEGLEEGKPFREAPQTTIHLRVFPTPEQTRPQRRHLLNILSAQISEHPSILALSETTPFYDPNESGEEMDGAESRRLLVHGTRSSSLRNLRYWGINPPWRPNTCAEGPAFFTTNNPELAYLHALFVQPRLFTADPVVFLFFKIFPPILHGLRELPSPPGFFSHLWLEASTDAKRRKH